MNNQERIQKLISQAGLMSRRKAEELIKQGKVKVNGSIAELGQKATFKDNIIVNGTPIFKQEHVYYVLNKPAKTITALSDDRGRQTVKDIMNIDKYVFPIGRLDFNTTGVLLLTNDGELANKLMHPSNEVIRTYRARLDSPLTLDDLKFLNSKDVKLDEEQSIQIVQHIEKKTYLVSLKQGKYHHVKRLFELVDRNVQGLHRIEFAGINVSKIPKGSFRKLKIKEVKHLKQL
ncbi:MAG: rRNA pseudouridine synthase [Mycoplasma sp.]|nr:rRNA pseudouridine synthase [Mycoplasma sp.]